MKIDDDFLRFTKNNESLFLLLFSEKEDTPQNRSHQVS